MGQRIDRMWLLGGLVVTVLLIVAGWFLLISPKYADAATVRGQVGDLNVQLVKLNHDVAALNKKKKDLPALKKQLAALQAALPTDKPGVTNFITQLQYTGTAVRVDVSGVTVGTPVQSKSVPSAYELAITLIASGDPDNLSQFLHQLQEVQPRAVLLTSIGLATGGNQSDPNQVQASLALIAFVNSSTGSTSSLTTN